MLHSAGWAHNAFQLGLTRESPVADWAPENVRNPLDILAQWTVPGHLIECGAQVSGGNYSNWGDVPNLATLTLPIAEIYSDGVVKITRGQGGGGMVNRGIVAEQLVYEIGDPAAYITPDVVVDMRNITLEDESEDMVVVTGAIGKPEPESLKVSAAFEGGWFAASSLLVSGPDALGRATACDAALRGRLSALEELEIYTEFIGGGVSLPENIRQRVSSTLNPPEVLLRWAVSSTNKQDITDFSREVAPLVLTGPAGVGGYGARPKPRRQLQFWPSLISRKSIEPFVRVELLTHLRITQESERFH
ncbi:MAG TPA: acyclic terpene utilization AtuA family protein, partial [Candidatus Thalassarchaeaceae archaeon]|nr:acyclic terpene utilization AtuA family protein [Candidatus Thalassarchaeaceae archaeon]